MIMSETIQDTSDITLNQNEYAFLVGDQLYYESYMKVRIPKLMPDLIGSGKEVFNRKIFLNADKCMPVSNKEVQIQDYITVKRSNQCSLADRANKAGFVPDGTRVICLCMNNDYRDMLIID